MFTFLRELIWGPQFSKHALDDAYKILAEAQKKENPLDDEESDEDDVTRKYQIAHKTGSITSCCNNTYEIDKKYKFTSDNLFVVGALVSYTVFADADVPKITNVQEIVDEWDSGQVRTGGDSWCLRTINVQVVSKQGRKLIADPGSIEIDLNETKSEFIPIVGDFLELETKSEIDESVLNLNGKILEIIKIRPVRAMLKEGHIKTFNEKQYTGTINRDIFFNKEALLNGYIPKVGDRVVVEIIESNQYNNPWRAVKILLQSVANKISGNPFGNLNRLPVYEHSIDGVTISENVMIIAKSFNETHVFHVSVMNDRNEDVNLKKVTIEGVNNQTKLQGKNQPVVIKPGETSKFAFMAVAKSTGTSREIILFHFDNVLVGRVVCIKLEAPHTASVPNIGGQVSRSSLYENMRRHVRQGQTSQPIPGERPRQAPRFHAKNVGDWRVPRALQALYTNFANHAEFHRRLIDEVTHQKPCLREPLTLHNYEERFHTLIHLEELYFLMCMRKYDLERAAFIRDGSYLILEMPGLAENRPSVIVGDCVVATCLTTSMQYEGFVHNSMGDHLRLKFSGVFHSEYTGDDYRIHVVPSRSPFRRVHQSVHLAATCLPELLFPNQALKKKPQVKFTYDSYEDIISTTGTKMMIREVPPAPRKCSKIELVKRMHAMQVKSSQMEEEPTKPPVGTKLLLNPTPNSRNVPRRLEYKLEWFDKSLNYHQKEAVRNILLGESRPLPYIIFGPPGTGKSVTVIECVMQILRMISHSRLLVATPSNSAANLLTLRLINSGALRPGDLVRLVSYKSILDNAIPPSIIPYCATASIAREGTAAGENTITEQGYVADMTMSTLGRHRITIGTCNALGVLQHIAFRKGHFTHVIVDEAGQCTEPEIMIPLTHVDTADGQIILAGDPMQLGPVVLCDVVQQLGMKETYMDRLIHRFPYLRDLSGFSDTGGYDPRLVTKLLYNYRALPELLVIPNHCFYHEELRATISESESEEAAFLQRFAEMLPVVDGRAPSLVFHGIDGVNQRGEDLPSWCNLDEASQVFYYINELYRLGAEQKDIGVITPYIKQVRQIREILKEATFAVPKIGTVEEFQGSEYKVIILSTVRSCSEDLDFDRRYSLGFIGNPQRFNVALTRSQCLTIVIGNPNLLKLDRHWGQILSHCRIKGTYVGCDMN